MRRSITHHPITKDTEHLVREAIRSVQDVRRRRIRDYDEEIRRLQKMLTDAGFGI